MLRIAQATQPSYPKSFYTSRTSEKRPEGVRSDVCLCCTPYAAPRSKPAIPMCCYTPQPQYIMYTQHLVHRTTFWTLLLAGLLTLLLPASAIAQNLGENPAIQDYGRPGVPRITIYVWGNAQTGVWTVEEGASMLEVVSATARVGLNERSPDRRQIHTLRVFRDGNRDGEPDFEARLEDVFSRSVTLPELRERDVLVIESRTRRRLSWRDISQVTGTIASVVSIFILLDRLDSSN